VKQCAEAFQLGGRKDNVLLQIEKGLLLTWIISDSVTVPGGSLIKVTYSKR
jgi:hypothetical protein